MLRGKGAELRAMLYGGGIRQLSGPLSFVASAGKHSFLHVKNGFFLPAEHRKASASL